tara:strand:+ start:252 stop:458 length:207 start_codon:yes stop_codon:yes gene_type:complete
MKTDKLFKMDLETGEAIFKQTKEFKHLDNLLKADILKDWIDQLIPVYFKAKKDLENELKSEALQNLKK